MVTNPDGSTDTVYTNFIGEVMLTEHDDPANGLHTLEAYQYNTQGQLILDATPAAVTGYDDSYANLLNNYPYLNNLYFP